MVVSWRRNVVARIEAGPLGRFATLAAWQTLFLFAVDSVSNVIDYLFHAYLGRSLTPGEFAVVQTLNAVFLIGGTALGVLQPVVARLVSQSRALDEPEARRAAIFRLYFYQSLAVGAVLSGLTWLVRERLGDWLNVPPAAIALVAVAVVMLLLRPVVNGMLQGQQRFVHYGLTHAFYAGGRLAAALVLVGLLGMGALGGVGAMPVGILLGLLAGLGLLGVSIWSRGYSLSSPESGFLLRQGWKLSLAAFVAYAAYMSLLNVDVIWMNRALSPETAGNYASAAVLRRVIAVLPGAVLTVLFPRVALQVAQGARPDRSLLKATAAITASTTALAVVYFVLGEWLVRLFFGPAYSSAGSLVGWMALGMIGAGVLAVWLNLFLASRPWPFVIVLALIAGLQLGMLALWGRTPEATVAVFVLTTWMGAASGAALYYLWLRPSLKSFGVVPRS